MTTESAQTNPRKIRFGLILIGFVFAASVVLFFLVNDPIGRAIFFALGVLALVRAFLLARWLRRQGTPAT